MKSSFGNYVSPLENFKPMYAQLLEQSAPPDRQRLAGVAILQIKSAQFYTITDGTDRALTTAPWQTGNWLGTEIFPANQRIVQLALKFLF
jgi:hypothetical protein